MVQVHHVACAVVFEVVVVAQTSRQEEMVHGVFGGVEGGGHIVETVFHLDLQVRIGHQGLDQVAGDVRAAGKKAAALRAAMFPIPIAADVAAERFVGSFLGDFQFFAGVAIEGGGEGAAHGGVGRIVLGVFGEHVVGGHGVACVVTAGGEAVAAHQFHIELREVYAQVGLQEVVFAEADEVRKFFRDFGFFGGSDVGAFHQRGGVIGGGEFTGFGEEGRDVGWRIGERFLIHGGGGVAGDVENVGQIIAGIEGDGAEIEDGRDEHDAVDVNAVVLLQVIAEGSGTEGAVTFADEKFRRVPAVVAIDIDVDELREHFDVLIYSPEIFILGFAYGVAEACADGVYEHHVGFVEQGIRIVFNFVRRGRSVGVVGGDDAARTEGAHVQPDGSGAGAAVVDEGDGALGEIFGVAARVGGGIDQRGGLAFFVFEESGGGGGFVGDGLVVDFNGVVAGPGFFLGRVGGVWGFCV